MLITLSACDLNGDLGEEPLDFHNLTLEIEGEGVVLWDGLEEEGSLDSPEETEEIEVEDGAGVDLTAEAADDYNFSSWKGEVQEKRSEETRVMMEEDRTVRAVFYEIKEGSHFAVNINEEASDEEVDPGEELTIVVDVENRGEDADTQEIQLPLEEEMILTEEVTLDPGEYQEVVFTIEVPEGVSPGEEEITVFSDDEEESYTVTISGEVDGELVRISEDVSEEFHWDYFIFVPESFPAEEPADHSQHLLVEPNNTGYTDDEYEEHEDEAERIASSHYVASKLGVPVLVPTFPRPESVEGAELDGYQYYTHALDRNTLKLDGESDVGEEYGRIDEQLIAMIDHAREEFQNEGIELEEQVFMMGFSASGTFVNRFITLHPGRVQAIAAGGINGLPIIPEEKVEVDDEERKLIYPVGVFDLQEIAGIDFDEASFKDIPQYLFMGEDDANDTLPYDDAYDEEEREIIEDVLETEAVEEDESENASIIIERFETAEEYYRDGDFPAQFATYENTGHDFTREQRDDVVEFFRKNAGDELRELQR